VSLFAIHSYRSSLYMIIRHDASSLGKHLTSEDTEHLLEPEGNKFQTQISNLQGNVAAVKLVLLVNLWSIITRRPKGLQVQLAIYAIKVTMAVLCYAASLMSPADA